MKKTTLKTDYDVGIHSWFERELHRRLPPWEADTSLKKFEERKKIAEEIFRENPARCSDIVVCEVCEEYLAEQKLSNGRPFACPDAVRKMHEQFEQSARTLRVRRIQSLFEGSSA